MVHNMESRLRELGPAFSNSYDAESCNLGPFSFAKSFTATVRKEEVGDVGLSPTKFQRYVLRTFPAEHLNYSDGDSAEREINVQSPPPSPPSTCNPMSGKKLLYKSFIKKKSLPLSSRALAPGAFFFNRILQLEG